jgi:hypothetical protein
MFPERDGAEARRGQETLDIRSAQALAWANKVAKRFNTTDVPLEFCLLQGDGGSQAVEERGPDL